MSAAGDWLVKLQGEPWFGGVQGTFAAQHIADPLWEATLYHEDASLDPAVRVQDHYADGSPAGYSTGLFQLNENGVGAGQSVATLTDPLQNAALAAKRMAAQFKTEGTGSADLATQLRTIERAGWNGGTTQDTARQADLAAITGAKGTSGVSLGPWQWIPGPTTVGGKAAAATGAAVSNAATSTFAPVITAATEIALALAVGGVFLALIAGGFAVAASPSSLTIAPVP